MLLSSKMTRSAVLCCNDMVCLATSMSTFPAERVHQEVSRDQVLSRPCSRRHTGGAVLSRTLQEFRWPPGSYPVGQRTICSGHSAGVSAVRIGSEDIPPLCRLLPGMMSVNWPTRLFLTLPGYRSRSGALQALMCCCGPAYGRFYRVNRRSLQHFSYIVLFQRVDEHHRWIFLQGAQTFREPLDEGNQWRRASGKGALWRSNTAGVSCEDRRCPPCRFRTSENREGPLAHLARMMRVFAGKRYTLRCVWLSHTGRWPVSEGDLNPPDARGRSNCRPLLSSK